MALFGTSFLSSRLKLVHCSKSFQLMNSDLLEAQSEVKNSRIEKVVVVAEEKLVSITT